MIIRWGFERERCDWETWRVEGDFWQGAFWKDGCVMFLGLGGCDGVCISEG